MGRAPCCEKVGLKRGRWTAEEDQILTNYIQANGEGSWRSLPKNAGLLRCGKSCRLRWINYLRADLKRGNITPQEEETIVKLHSALGNRWSLIAAQLPGRTDNEIKNYWNSHLSRRIYSFSKTIKETKPTDIDIATITRCPTPTTGDHHHHHQSKRRNGRTSRSAMKRQKLALISLGINPKTNDKVLCDDDDDPKPQENSSTTGRNDIDQMHGSCMNNSAKGTCNNNYDDHERQSSTGIALSSSAGEDFRSNYATAAAGEMYGCSSSERENEHHHDHHQHQEEEVMGPYEWLDNEIKRLSSILQTDHHHHHHQYQQGLDHPNPSGNPALSDLMTHMTNVEANGVQKGAEKPKIDDDVDQETESSGLMMMIRNASNIADEISSIAEENRWLEQLFNNNNNNNSSSVLLPGNSSSGLFEFDHDHQEYWVSGSGFHHHDHHLWELCDDSDKVLCWLLDGDINNSGDDHQAGNTAN